MSDSRAEKSCPECGAPMPSDAPQGLCPQCLLAGAATQTDADEPDGSRHTPPPIEAVAAAFPQLEILGLIGQGGMGCVFKARQSNLDRIVALKLLPRALASKPAFGERFNREARVLARLHHPNIVTIFDFGQSGGFCYLLMEYVDGVNLRQAMRAGRFTPAQALAVVPKICEALQFAHDEGILHRDIKPENILLDNKGRVKIADFGIAKLMGDPRGEVTLTGTGATLGTPAYMAPEQIEKPAEVDHRADIYSLGVVFYEMLTGELPLGRFAAPSKKTSLDERVDDIVLRALAKERELRQQSAGEVKTQVEGVASTASASVAADRRGGVSAAPSGSPQPLTAADTRRTSWKAVVSAVLSIPLWLAAVVLTAGGLVALFRRDVALSSIGGLHLLELLGFSFGGLLGLTGLVLGVFAVNDIRRSNGRLKGTGLAVMGVLGAPFGMAVTLTPALMLGLSAAGYLPPAVGRRFYELAPLCLVGAVVLAAIKLKRWADQPVAPGSEGVNRRALYVGAGAVAVLLVLPFAAMVLGSLRQMGSMGTIPAGSATDPVTSGCALLFRIPAGQAAVFEVVTKTGDEVVALPRFSGYVLAPADRVGEGTFRFERDPQNDLPGLRRPWQLTVHYGSAVSSIGGLDLPAAMAASIGSSSATLDLKGDSEIVNWLHPGNPNQAAVGVRVRTQSHGRLGIEPGREGSLGLGNDWRKALAFTHGRSAVEMGPHGLVGTGTNWLAEFDANRRSQPTEAGSTNAGPSLQLTFVSVELRDDAGARWLAFDYVEDVQGECEIALKTEGEVAGFLPEVRKTMTVVSPEGSPIVRHNRVEWRLPDILDRGAALAARERLAKQWRYRSVVLRLGESRELFNLPVPSRGTLIGSVGMVVPLPSP